MEINNELVLGLATILGGIFTTIFAFFQNKQSKKQKKLSDAQVEVGEKRNELDEINTQKEEVNEQLLMKTAECVCYDKNGKILEAIIQKVAALNEEYTRQKKELYDSMNEIWDQLD